MSFLTQVEKINTANQLQTWYNSTKQSMMTAKSNYESIATQLEAMKTNAEYSADDIVEVDNLLAELRTLANSMV